MNFGKVFIRNRLIMAPMAGVTDRFFREIVWAHGAGLTVSEMVSAKSLVYQNKKTLSLLDNAPHIRPWSVQFFGSEPEIIAEAIKRLEVDFDIVDINMGCPMPKIVNNGEGAALMKNPERIGQIIRAAVKASPRPVTIKIRKGFTPATINCVDVAKIAEDAGASAIAVHGRTRDQYYTGVADWDAIMRVKSAVKIPVLGNGDIFTPEEAIKRLQIVDGILIARGAMGNPWLFSRTCKGLETGVVPPKPTDDEIIIAAMQHLNMVAAANGWLPEMRKHLQWYTKGMKGSSEARRRLNTAESPAEMQEILNNLKGVMHHEIT